MGIVLNKFKLLLLGSYGQQQKVWAITQPFFVLEQNLKKSNPPKIGKKWLSYSPFFFSQEGVVFIYPKLYPYPMDIY